MRQNKFIKKNKKILAKVKEKNQKENKNLN